MTFFDSWDGGEPGATYDSGLQWDVNVGPDLGDISKYLKLVTSEHADKPNFIAVLSMLLQPLADIQALVATIPGLFDIDDAVGSQLDVIGEWVGISRNITVALPNVYFSFGISGLGFSQAVWRTSADPLSGLVVLPDDHYRLLLRARIANNQWDGTIPGAYAIWDSIFSVTGIGVLIQDYGNMHMALALTGPIPDALTLALLTGGYFDLRPAGVKIDTYYTPSVASAPFFGFGAQNDSVAGFGSGAWGQKSLPA
jgi:hypothetical protein